jgi:catechol 2,3-dioxygenase-like lactoylglutathione lyase family enzyme
MLKKIDHINIVVKDLYGAKKFFLDLGFNVIHEGPLSGIAIEKVTGLTNVKAEYCALGLKNGQTNVELICYAAPEDNTKSKQSSANQPGFRHMAFEVDNIEKIVAKLQKNGVTFFSDIQTYGETNKKLCYFYGPERIILELAEYKKS